MTEKRKGFKYVTSLPINEEFVDMIIFKDKVFVASTKCVYELIDDTLHTIKIEIEE